MKHAPSPRPQSAMVSSWGTKRTFAQLLIMLDDMTRLDDNVLQIMHVEGALRVRNMVS